MSYALFIQELNKTRSLDEVQDLLTQKILKSSNFAVNIYQFSQGVSFIKGLSPYFNWLREQNALTELALNVVFDLSLLDSVVNENFKILPVQVIQGIQSYLKTLPGYKEHNIIQETIEANGYLVMMVSSIIKD